MLCTGDGVQVSQYEVVQPTFAGDFRVLTARILIPDGRVLLPSDAGCAASGYGALCAALLHVYKNSGRLGLAHVHDCMSISILEAFRLFEDCIDMRPAHATRSECLDCCTIAAAAEGRHKDIVQAGASSRHICLNRTREAMRWYQH